MPRISVIVPCFNVAKYVERAVSSVLSQTEADFELILVDDGSRDETVSILEGFSDLRIKVIRKESNSGMADAFKIGLENSTAELVAFLGADDALEPDCLEALAAEFADSNVGFAIGRERFLNEAGMEIDPPKYLDEKPVNLTSAEWMRKFLAAQNAGFGGLMLRKSAIKDVGGSFDGTFAQLSDLELYLRLLKAGYELKVVERALYWQRIRADSISSPTESNCDVHVAQLDRIRQKHYFKDAKPKIMIATPFYENKGYSPYIRSMFQTVYTLARHTKLDFDFQEVSGGSYIDHNRNMMADMFLESDCTHLFFLDSDQSWDVQGFLNVLKADKDVVGAAYPVKNNWEHYGVTIHCDEQGLAVVDKDGLIKAQKVPTGFMKIHRRVFEKLRAANPHDWYYHGEHKRLYNYFGHLTMDHVRYGEDISFGIRWQAIGGEIWLEPRVSMGHYGTKGWYGNYHQYLRKQPGGDLEQKAA